MMLRATIHVRKQTTHLLGCGMRTASLLSTQIVGTRLFGSSAVPMSAKVTKDKVKKFVLDMDKLLAKEPKLKSAARVKKAVNKKAVSKKTTSAKASSRVTSKSKAKATTAAAKAKSKLANASLKKKKAAAAAKALALKQKQREKEKEKARVAKERLKAKLAKAKIDKRKIIPPVVKPPSRPLTAYIIFSKERYIVGSIKSITDATAAMKANGEAWSNLSADEKAVYQAKAATAKAEYDNAVAKFYAELTPEQLAAENKRRKTMAANGGKKLPTLKNPNAPKRGKTAFVEFGIQYRKDNAAQLEGKRVNEVVNIIAASWNKLTPAQKKPFEELAQHDKERYARELEAYKAKFE
ncbi:hypothetical protein GQ42DRAFT_163292 [Ramicandelaber brevisporus]|nr:hypothetical protein GQ42DRAFT_163292 [Ramicandelaber brevisporus]